MFGFIKSMLVSFIRKGLQALILTILKLDNHHNHNLNYLGFPIVHLNYYHTVFPAGDGCIVD